MSETVINDLSVSKVDGWIDTCNDILNDLEGKNGLEAFSDADNDINNNFSGEYKEALSNSVLETKASYIDSISNVRALKEVLYTYRNFLKHGTGGKLSEDGDNKNIDVSAIYKQITELESVITEQGKLESILTNDEDFDTWLSSYEALSTTCGPQDENIGLFEKLAEQREEKKNIEIFLANKEVYANVVNDVEMGLSKTATLVTELEVIAGVLSGELSGFSAIWDAFGFTKSDYQNYLVAHYDGLTQEDMNDLKTDIANGDIESIIDDVIDIINDMLDEQATSEDIAGAVAVLQGKLAGAMINDYKVNGELNGNYTEILQLLAAITYVFQYYPHTVINPVINDISTVSVVGLEYKNGILTLTLKSSEKENYTWTENIDISEVYFGNKDIANGSIQNEFTENYNGTWFGLLGIAATYIPGGHVGNFANLTASVDTITAHNDALSIAIREEVINAFGGHSAPGQEPYPDASTVLTIYIANDLGVIDISDKNENIRNFLKLSEEEQEERLVYLCSNDSSEIHHWLDAPMTNPLDGSNATRQSILGMINGKVSDRI